MALNICFNFTVIYKVSNEGRNGIENWKIEKRKHLQPHRTSINCLIKINRGYFDLYGMNVLILSHEMFNFQSFRELLCQWLH